MKKIIITLLFIASLQLCNAQAKSVFFELGGPGLASINYDMRFSKAENGLGGRVGIGGFSLGFNDGGLNARSTVIFVPIGVNYLIGKNTKNYFEIGGGVTPVFTNATVQNDSENFSSTFGHLNFGYRLQPQNSGFTFRAFITPVFGEFGFFPYYGGVSFGYKF